MYFPRLILIATCMSAIGLVACGKAISQATSGKALLGDVGTRHILVDQFGYRPQDPKVAVIRTPHQGYDRDDVFTPGARYEVRRADTSQAVYSGELVPWNKGAVQPTSGDSGWWFDFSSVTEPGKYFIYDVQKKVRSAAFNIDARVYKNVLKAAMRTYFYQRSGFAKKPPYAEACWSDNAAYLGPNQDREAHDVTDRNNRAKVRDLSGGWFDAGDTNKYVTFAAQPVHQLLTAFEENDQAFTDDFNIPESGNGIPDVIDEVKYETDWLKKMQFPDGSVAAKVGVIAIGKSSPPSSDPAPRYYIPACTSATISAAGMFAHAAYVYKQFPALTAEADDLKQRALKAWSNFNNSPQKQTKCDTGVVYAGNSDLTAEEQAARAVVAAVYLYAITGDTTFDAYLQAHHTDARPYHDFGWSRYNPDQGEALLFYTKLSIADAALKEKIVRDKKADISSAAGVYGLLPETDLYRAFIHDQQYHWGSHQPRANYGNSNLDAVTYGIVAADDAQFVTRALDTLHYFHGVNPFGLVYLSNMYSYGATVSANEIFHTWFQPGTRWSDAKTSQCGPAPGFVPGGPNAGAVASGVPSTLTPPAGQPPQKSYRDYNSNWPENSWAVSEPGIYYQASYVKLLSAFVH